MYRVKDIAKTGTEVTIEATTDVVGITTGALPAADITSTIFAFTPIVQNINQVLRVTCTPLEFYVLWHRIIVGYAIIRIEINWP